LVRWFLVRGELCLRRLHLSLSLKAPPTYLSNTLTTTTADETLTSTAAYEQVRRRPSFLLEDDLVTRRPLSLYLDYISLPMLLFFFPNLTLTTSAGIRILATTSMVATRGQCRNAPAGLWNIATFFVTVDANLIVP
jgi:hypothetical protein